MGRQVGFGSWLDGMEKLLVYGFWTKSNKRSGPLRAWLSREIDLSSSTLRHESVLIAAHRWSIGSRWRRLIPGRQALLVLAHLRRGDTHAQLATDLRVGTATVYRCVREAVEALAARAPTLSEAVAVTRAKAHVILGGTLLPIACTCRYSPTHSGGSPGSRPRYPVWRTI